MDFNLDLSVDVLARTPATLVTLLSGTAEPWVRGVEGLIPSAPSTSWVI
jgi:hypothetical protein